MHLTTGKRIKIIDIAKTIKKILLKKKIRISISSSNKKDDLQNNRNNIPNKFFLKFWKPKYSIEEGIEKIIYYYYKN